MNPEVITIQQEKRIHRIEAAFFLFLVPVIFFVVGYLYPPMMGRVNAMRAEFVAQQTAVYESSLKLEADLLAKDYVQALSDYKPLRAEVTSLRAELTRYGQDSLLLDALPQKSATGRKIALLVQTDRALRPLDAALALIEKINFAEIYQKNGALLDLSPTRANLSQALANLAEFRRAVSAIDEPTLQKIAGKLADNDHLFQLGNNLVNEDLKWLFSGQKNLLVIFQNNNELRGGSGGSLGSFGVARLTNGRLPAVDFGTNIYKLDTAFMAKETVTPPTELEAFGDKWSMKQSGFAVDGRGALDKIRWFYAKETGDSAAGAVSIDTSAITELLKITGPIEMTAYKKTLSADNFVSEVQDEVLVDYFKDKNNLVANEPKKILGDMMPIFIDRLSAKCRTRDGALEVWAALRKLTAEKHIVLNFEKASLQSQLYLWNLTGQINPSVGDYLSVNNSNLAGMKTDQNMRETLDLSATINATGEINNELTLSRQHTGVNVLPDGLDRNYVRVLVPAGSTVSTFQMIAGNFQRYYDRGYRNGQPYWVDTEAGKSTVNFWLSTWPGATSSAKISYTSSHKIDLSGDFEYTIMLQRQPGATADTLHLTLAYPAGFYPALAPTLSSPLQISATIDHDQTISIKFKRKN